MRFLIDECAGPALARWLRQQDHEIFSVYEDARGMKDEEHSSQSIRRKLDFADSRQRFR